MLADITVIAGWLARTGWHLSSGGADGADSAFAAGAPAGQRTVWLPWRGYNGHRGPDCRVLSAAAMAACMAIAAPLHPAWERCSPAVRKLHARNVAVLSGARPLRRAGRVAWPLAGERRAVSEQFFARDRRALGECPELRKHDFRIHHAVPREGGEAANGPGDYSMVRVRNCLPSR